MQLRVATKQTDANIVPVIKKKSSIKCETGKWEADVTNDSIGTCSSGLYLHYLLKLPAPPRAVLLVCIYIYVYMKNIYKVYIYIHIYTVYILFTTLTPGAKTSQHKILQHVQRVA